MPLVARAAQMDLAAPAGALWAQFGDEVVLYGDETAQERLRTGTERATLQVQELQASMTPERLYLVVQNGRLFQRENPDVPVMVDRGRFLMVELDPNQARQLMGAQATCYGLRPFTESQVVFRTRQPAVGRAAPDACIQSLVDRVTRSSLEADLTHLVSHPTRLSTSSHFAEAATWAREQLEAMSYLTQLQSIVVHGNASMNVIADKPGSGTDTRRLVLVVAHLDSINQRDGPGASAPGADDNGSGSVGLLQMARVLQDHPNLHDLRFVLFGGEEQGLFGSTQYVAGLPDSERSRIQAVINMDMIGSLNSPTASVLLEGAPLSQAVIDGLSEAAATYTPLVVETSLHPFASDHVPFIAAGIPAVLTIEGADNANSHIHSAEDTIDRINYDLAVEILRMNVAFVGQLVGN
jgi:hypothetical protein